MSAQRTKHIVEVYVDPVVIDYGPREGERTFEARVVYRSIVVSEVQGDDIPTILRRVANALEGAGRLFS